MGIQSGSIAIRRIDIPHTGTAVATPKPVDLKAQIETVMKETHKGRIRGRFTQCYGWDTALVEQIVQLYVTHPGVTAYGIMGKMGI